MEENKDILSEVSVSPEEHTENALPVADACGDSAKSGNINDNLGSETAESGSESDVSENGGETEIAKSDSEATENEGAESLEYETAEGSWREYEAENSQRYNSGNGVYPDHGRMGGAYFGGYNGGDANRPYGQYLWQSYKESQTKKSSKKHFIVYALCGILAVFLIVSAAISGYQLYSSLLDDMNGVQSGSGDTSGSGSGQQSGGSQSGGSQSGGGQSGGSQSSGASSGSTSTGSGNIQNGDFALTQESAGEQYKLSEVYRMVESTVVAITTSGGSGSGVIISADEKNGDGYYIVTNNHVVEGETAFTVAHSNGTQYSATLIGTDKNTDLAVLKIIAEDLQIATIGKSGDLLIAEEVLVIGNPLGTFGVATNGIISAKNTSVNIDGYVMSLIQTNAAINGGNSGGGMFNLSGQLVGVVNAKYVSEGVEGTGFAIPIDSARPIIEDIINYGYVKGRPDIGFKVTYGYISIERYNAYWVSEITEGSEAANAGLKSSDVILELKINGEDYKGTALAADLNELKIGDVLEMTVRRYTQVVFNRYTYEDVVVTFTLTEYQG